MKIIIIDDEPIALEKLKNYVGKVPYLELVGQYNSAVEALPHLAAGAVDAIFTDIDMPDLDGMQLIESLARPPMVVFTTAHSRYAIDSYRLSAVDYLLKPYSFADFQRACGKLLHRFQSQQGGASSQATVTGGSLFVKVDTRYRRLNMADIFYVKGYGEYLQIFVDGEKMPVVTLGTMSGLRDKLSDSFMQTHRSYIVNMDRIERLERARVIMPGDTDIPIGDNYRAELLEYVRMHGLMRH